MHPLRTKSTSVEKNCVYNSWKDSPLTVRPHDESWLLVKSKKPSFDSEFYTKRVLNPVFNNIKKTRVTNNILRTKLFPDSSDFIFQQDGATCHTSKLTKKFIQKKKIQLLEPWPPNSPDLNPIGNLWSILTEKVYQVEIKTVDQLKRRVRKCCMLEGD